MKCVECEKKECKNHHRLCDKCWGNREKRINKMIKKDNKKHWSKRRTRKQMIKEIKKRREE